MKLAFPTRFINQNKNFKGRVLKRSVNIYNNRQCLQEEM